MMTERREQEKRHGTGTGRRARTGNEPRGAEVASTELARKINRDMVLELIRQRQPIARIDLARASGLQNSTVSSIIEQLVREGWVREGEALKTPRGRRPTLISLNDSLAMLVADIRPGSAVFGVVDLNGQLVRQSEMRLHSDARRGVEDLGDVLATLRAEHADHGFVGLGVCVPGRVDGATGRLVMAPNLQWNDYDIRGVLAKRLGMPVEMENDANACLLSELWFGHLDGVKNAVLLAISEGLGASLLANSHLIAGRLGLAGEFGHLCFSPGGPVCACGRHGCWELYASSRAALGYFRSLAPSAPEMTYRELAHRALEGDAMATQAIERQARAIGAGLRTVTASLAPELILFAGDISYAWPLVQPIVVEACRRTLLTGKPPRLVCTGDGQQAHLLGAAALILQRHAEYYRSRPAERAANVQLAGAR